MITGRYVIIIFIRNATIRPKFTFVREGGPYITNKYNVLQDAGCTMFMCVDRLRLCVHYCLIISNAFDYKGAYYREWGQLSKASNRAGYLIFYRS